MRVRVWMAIASAAVIVLVAPSVGAKAGGDWFTAPNGVSVNVAPLIQAGFSRNTITSLGNNARMVSMLLATGQISPSQAAHLAASLIETPVSTAPGGGPVPVALPPTMDCVSGTGAEWDVWTTTGWDESTGYLDLPSTSNANSSNDAFFASMGAFASGGNADVGVWTNGNGTWNLYENGKYEHDWTSDSFSQASYPDIYLNLTISSSTSLDLEVIDATTWTVLYNQSFPNISASYNFNTTGSNEGMYRFDSIAQNTESLSDGSYAHHYDFSQVYEYSPSTYQLVTTYGAEAGKKCSTAEKATVTDNSSINWYQDDISIDY